MKTRFVSLLILGVLVAASLSAQTKTSGTATCKADPPAPVALTDKPNHSFGIGKAQCTWTGFEVAGQPYKDGASTSLDEVTGDAVATLRGYHTATTSSGDTTTARFQGSGKMKDGKFLSGEGTWTFTSGTGKLKGIKGKGTYKGKPNADGTMGYEVTGEYQLP